MKNSGRLADEQIEQVIAGLLRIGIIAAAILVFAGGILYLIRYGTSTSDLRVFQGEPRRLRSISGIAANAWKLDSLGIIQLGFLVLVATPIARVIFSVVAFLLQRDLIYVLVTLIVLGVLLYSVAGGGFP
jgi:uncharacterized membrane protein